VYSTFAYVPNGKFTLASMYWKENNGWFVCKNGFTQSWHVDELLKIAPHDNQHSTLYGNGSQ